MADYYLAHGVSHMYVESPDHTIRFAQFMRNWVPQWTTPNNTRKVIASSQDEALSKWVAQPFQPPRDFPAEMILGALRFHVKTVLFADGFETYSSGVISHDVFLKP